jgi:hypothetical protein
MLSWDTGVDDGALWCSVQTRNNGKLAQCDQCDQYSGRVTNGMAGHMSSEGTHRRPAETDAIDAPRMHVLSPPGVVHRDVSRTRCSSSRGGSCNSRCIRGYTRYVDDSGSLQNGCKWVGVVGTRGHLNRQ